MKKCTKCSAIKELSEFYKNKCNMVSSIAAHCKSCDYKRKKDFFRKKPLYQIWRGIVSRCNNPNNKSYHRYGERGIKCRWETYKSFYDDMGVAYEEGLTIDRINNDGDYSKENCRWSTRKDQSRNKSNNIKYNGSCITDIGKTLGGSRSLVNARLKRGWDLVDAASLPKQYSSFVNKKTNIKFWCEQCGQENIAIKTNARRKFCNQSCRYINHYKPKKSKYLTIFKK